MINDYTIDQWDDMLAISGDDISLLDDDDDNFALDGEIKVNENLCTGM